MKLMKGPLVVIAVIACVLCHAQSAPIARPRVASEKPAAAVKKAKAKVLPERAWRSQFQKLTGGWKEAEKWMTAARLFPYDSIPEGSVERAIAHRDALPPAQIRLQDSQNFVMNGFWQFVGPKNLAVPYRRWWGPAPVSGRVNGAAFDPVVAGRYYIALPNGGLWRTNDSGVSWTNLSTSTVWTTLETSCVAIDPSNNQHILVGMGDHPTNLMWLGTSPGIMRSTDGGTTWNLVGTNMAGRTVSDIVFNPSNTQEVVATLSRGPAQAGGVLRSTDGGGTWTISFSSGLFTGAALSVPRLDATRNLYVVGDGNFMFRSRDFGLNWTSVTMPSHPAGAFCNITTSPNVADRIYLLYSTSMPAANGAVWRSDDAGGTWVNLSPNTSSSNDFQAAWWGQASYNYTLEAVKRPWEPNQDLLYVGLIGVHMLGNPEASSGFVWSDIGQTTRVGTSPNFLTGSPAVTHNDQHVFARDTSGFDMLIGNDGGIYRLNFNAFNNLNFNVSASHFYHAAFHPTLRDVMIGGTQDNASPSTSASSGWGDIDNWNNVGGGDGGWALIDWDNTNIQYAEVQGGGTYRTTDSWASWNRDTLPSISNTRQDPGTFPFITVMEMQRTDPKLVWVASNTRLYRWNQTAGTWTNRVGGWQLNGSGDIRAVCTSPSDAGVMLVGALDGETWISEQSFASDNFRIDNPPTGTQLPDRVISDFSFHPTNPNSFLVSLGGFGTPHLWLGTWDPVDNSISWVNVSGTGASGLPNIQINTIERDPFDVNNTWYVGTDIGVFMTDNGGTTWTNATQPLGLPPVPVNHLQYVPGTGYLNAATWGRGIWRIRLGRPPLSGLLLLNPILRGGLKIPARVTLAYSGQEPVEINLSASKPWLVQMPQQVVVQPGQTEVEFDIWTQPVSVSESITFTAESGGFTRTATARLDPPDYTILLEPSSLQGGSLSLGTIVLEAPAPPGMVVYLSSNNPNVAAPAVGSIDFTQGQTVEYFMVNTQSVSQDVWVRLSANIGNEWRDAWMEVVPLQIESISCPSPIVRAGQTYSLTVRLRRPSALASDIDLQSNHSACPLPSQVSFAPGQQEAQVEMTVGDISGREEVQFRAIKGQSVANTTVTAAPPLLEGQVIREGIVPMADPSGAVVMKFRNPGQASPFLSLTVALDHQGRFSMDAPRLAPFDLAIKDANWLRVVRSFDGYVPATLNFSLPNGDVNQDNSVNIADFLAFRAAFGSAPGSPNWNPMADLNRDGSVGVPDFLILRGNFGRSGQT